MTIKIIGGKFRNTKLYTAKANVLRPTLGRIRENLFNIIQNEIFRARFLDLYAGIGAIGLEALSRGAECGVFVETHPECRKVLQRNIEKLKLDSQTQIISFPVSSAVKSFEAINQQFDIVFADPPYRQQEGEKVLQQLAQSTILSSEGLLIIQTERKEILVQKVGNLEQWQVRTYGDTTLWFYRTNANIES